MDIEKLSTWTWNAYKKDYVSGKTIKQLSYFHSIITGACFTFFIGLFSAGPDSISNSYSLWFSTLGFATSALLNTCFSLFYTFMNNERELVFEIQTYSLIGVLSLNAALFLPIISFILLLFYYSVQIGFLLLIFIASIIPLVKIICYEIKKYKNKIEKTRMKLIDEKRFDEYGVFCKKYDFPIFTKEEEIQRAINFYFHIKTDTIIESWMKSLNSDSNELNVELLKNDLLNITSEICNAQNPNYELLMKIKNIIVLTIKKDSSTSNGEIMAEISNLTSYIEIELCHLR